jgi:hypothetical protein
MEIHKPKPVHAWRELLSEIGVIVIGVLIALAAEQVVEILHWHHQIAISEGALADDFDSVVSLASEREAVSSCIDRRLDQLSGFIDQASETHRLPAIGTIGVPPIRLWKLTSWDSFLSSQAAAHLSHDALLSYSGIADFSTSLTGLNLAEINEWARLTTMVGPGRRLGDTEDAELRASLARARLDAELLRNGSSQILDMIKTTRLLDARRFSEDQRQGKASAYRPLCKSLGPVPSHYTSSPILLSLTAPIAR